MASGEVARQATQFAVSVVLARLVAPVDFGLLAMALFVTGLVETVAAFGSTEALVQKPDASPDDWSSVYWLGLLLSLAVALIVVALGPVAAAFYRDRRVIPILSVLAWVGFLRAVGATQSAWLAKQMRFRTIAQAEWIGVVAGGAVGLTMAWTGWGVWSLVANSLVGLGVTSVLLHVACPWRPRPVVRALSLRATLRFGLGMQGFGIVNYFNRRLDDALIGRYVGPTGLGYYSRAYALMLYPVQNIAGGVGRVMFPALAEIGGDLPRFRAAYLRAVSAIATVTFPAMLGLLVTAPEVIGILYGPRWMPTVTILQVLCVVGMLQSISTTVGWIYLARARTDLMLWWGTGAAVVICSSFFVGVRWGVMGVTVAYALAYALLLVPSLLIPYRLIQLPLSDLLRSVGGTLAGAVVMACLVALVREVLVRSQVGQTLTLAASVASGVAIYSAWLWLIDSRAIAEVRLAWAHVAEARGAATSEGSP